MIHRIAANRPSFRAVEFGAGLNVVLADRTEAATDKDTRNGLGKTTLIDIVDFCLGARVRWGEGLVIDALAGWEFTLEFSVGRERFTATWRWTGRASSRLPAMDRRQLRHRPPCSATAFTAKPNGTDCSASACSVSTATRAPSTGPRIAACFPTSFVGAERPIWTRFAIMKNSSRGIGR